MTLYFYESCTNEFSDIVHLVFILIVASLQLQCVIGTFISFITWDPQTKHVSSVAAGLNHR